MAGALALVLPLILWALSRCSPGQQKWLSAAVVLITWAWLGCWTRGAWLAGGISLVWLLVWDSLSRQKLVLRPLIVGMTLFAFTAALGPTEGRNLSISGEGDTQALGDSSGRSLLWISAIGGISQKPLTGWGPPALWRFMATQPSQVLMASNGLVNVQVIKRLQQTPEQPPGFLIRHTDGRKELLYLSINKVHNEYLDYALTFGVPASVLFLTVLIMGILQAKSDVTGISAGLLAYACYLFTWPEIIRFAPLAWLCMGIALASGTRAKWVKIRAQG
nr:O-antigen ligase family protein [Deinococcus arcticus]